MVSETEGGNPNPIPIPNRKTESTPVIGKMGFFWELDGGMPDEDMLWRVWDSLRMRPVGARRPPVVVFNTYLTVMDDEDPPNELEEATMVHFYCYPPNKRFRGIMFHLLRFIKDYPPPATIFFVSGNPEFAPFLRKLKGRGYQIMVIGTSDDASSAFRNAGLLLYDWGPIVRSEGIFPLESGSKKRDYASFSEEA